MLYSFEPGWSVTGASLSNGCHPTLSRTPRLRTSRLPTFVPVVGGLSPLILRAGIQSERPLQILQETWRGILMMGKLFNHASGLDSVWERHTRSFTVN